MSVEGKFDSVSVDAGADLSALQYRIINISGTLAVTEITALGVLQNDPESGESATVGYRGHLKGKTGGAVTKGDRLTSNSSGALVSVSSGDTAGVVGKALATASSGGLVEFVGDFSNVTRVTNVI